MISFTQSIQFCQNQIRNAVSQVTVEFISLHKKIKSFTSSSSALSVILSAAESVALSGE